MVTQGANQALPGGGARFRRHVCYHGPLLVPQQARPARRALASRTSGAATAAVVGGLLAVGFAKPAFAKPAFGDNAPPTHYMGRPIAATMHWEGAPWLTRASREEEERPDLLLAALGVLPGMTVCDVGAGSGFHAVPLAGLVGKQGRVLAADVQQEMLTLLQKNVQAAGMTNVKAILAAPDDPMLGAQICDLVLLVDVYHELAFPEQVLAKLRGALTTHGRVALVEFRAEDPKVPIKAEHKMSRAQALREFAANGFALSSSYDGLPWQHVLFFEKKQIKP